ncbi:acyltransferase family protein [Herbaspirillum frisingense]|uniref:Fucose 4-O-acetylase-like acetyltransferase n=1 Tax=Herbaspirillum frisingense TaxID=92645 RepID=A0ABU1PD14_9BURK|nr:acyltransferase [Herbaspirillum frisingense]MDR6583820.1 fucose 4-O-acetylase-like acetyltransferase [Herbaspirillum frisingense]
MRLTVQRTQWVDKAKGLGILLVVVGHSSQYLYSNKAANILSAGIYSFHMPLFFVLAGLFAESSLRKHGVRQFAIDKLQTILYPYLIWSLFEGSYRYLLGRITSFSDFVGLHRIAQIAYAPIYHYWFLYILLACFCAFVLVNVAAPRLKPQLLLFIAAATLFVASNLFPPGTTRQFSDSLIFFTAGVYLGRVHLWSSDNTVIKELAWIAGAFFILFNFGILTKFSGEIARATKSLTLAAIGITLSCLAAGSIRSDSKVGIALSYCGRNSMAIFLFHIPPMAITKFLLDVNGVKDAIPHLSAEISVGITFPILMIRYVLPGAPLLHRWPPSAIKRPKDQVA